MTSAGLPLRRSARPLRFRTPGVRLGLWLLAITVVLVLALVVLVRNASTVAIGTGPLQVGHSMSSGLVLKPGTEFGYGLVMLEAPDEGSYRVLSARPLVEPAEASLGTAYALGPERAIGGVQFTKAWPPRSRELKAVPAPLPAALPAANHGSLELFVGMRVPDGGLVMHGVEVEYTDGHRIYRAVVPHAVRVCVTGEECPPPPLA